MITSPWLRSTRTSHILPHLFPLESALQWNLLNTKFTFPFNAYRKLLPRNMIICGCFPYTFCVIIFRFFWTLLYALFSPFDTDFRHFNHCYTSSAGKWNLEMLKQKEMKDLSTRAVFLLDLFFVFHSSLIWANCPLLYLFGYFKQKIFCSCLFAVCLQFTAASFMHTNMEITKCEKEIWFCILFLRHFHRNIFQWNQYNAIVFFLCQSSWLLWLWLWFRLWLSADFFFYLCYYYIYTLAE